MLELNPVSIECQIPTAAHRISHKTAWLPSLMAPATLHINRYWLSMCELHEAWCDQQQWCDQPECESDELDHRKRAWRRGLFST
jgi:hypothetical protein